MSAKRKSKKRTGGDPEPAPVETGAEDKATESTAAAGGGGEIPAKDANGTSGTTETPGATVTPKIGGKRKSKRNGGKKSRRTRRRR